MIINVENHSFFLLCSFSSLFVEFRAKMCYSTQKECTNNGMGSCIFTHTNVEMLSVFHTFYFSYDSSDKKTTARWNESATCGRHCWLWLLLDFMSIFRLRFWHSHTCTFTIWLKRFGNSISSQLAAGPLWYLCPR